MWLANLSPLRGTEPGKRRPVLIVQAQALIYAGHPSTLIIPFTTNLINDAEPLRFRVLAQGLSVATRTCSWTSFEPSIIAGWSKGRWRVWAKLRWTLSALDPRADGSRIEIVQRRIGGLVRSFGRAASLAVVVHSGEPELAAHSP